MRELIIGDGAGGTLVFDDGVASANIPLRIYWSQIIRNPRAFSSRAMPSPAIHSLFCIRWIFQTATTSLFISSIVDGHSTQLYTLHRKVR